MPPSCLLVGLGPARSRPDVHVDGDRKLIGVLHLVSPQGLELVDLVERGAAYGRNHEKATAFAEISNQTGSLVAPAGHYLYAYDYNGTLLAHPYLQAAVGSSLIERQDPFGMKNIRALRDTARDGGGFIVFVWPNPDKENREELKIGYVLPVDEDWWVGSGVYLFEVTGTDAALPSPAP